MKYSKNVIVVFKRFNSENTGFWSNISGIYNNINQLSMEKRNKRQIHYNFNNKNSGSDGFFI